MKLNLFTYVAFKKIFTFNISFEPNLDDTTFDYFIVISDKRKICFNLVRVHQGQSGMDATFLQITSSNACLCFFFC